MWLLCRHGLTLIERCYDNIDAVISPLESSDTVTTDASAVTKPLYADVVVDVSTCVLLRDASLLCDVQQSQQLALGISTLAAKYQHCCVIVTPCKHDRL